MLDHGSGRGALIGCRPGKPSQRKFPSPFAIAGFFTSRRIIVFYGRCPEDTGNPSGRLVRSRYLDADS